MATRSILRDSTNDVLDHSNKTSPFKGTPERRAKYPFDWNAIDSPDPSTDESNSNASSLSSYPEHFADQYETHSPSSTGPQYYGDTLILNSALKAKRKAVTDDNKYKTELCKNWIEHGTCNYGKKCKFAHGRHELMEKAGASKSHYRCRKCHAFFTNNMCPYGVRCMFAHEQRTLAEINSEYYYSKFLLFPEFLECQSTANKRTLPVFESLKAYGSVDGALGHHQPFLLRLNQYSC